MSLSSTSSTSLSSVPSSPSSESSRSQTLTSETNTNNVLPTSTSRSTTSETSTVPTHPSPSMGPPPGAPPPSLRNSSSLLFGFLVTFLALFVVFMVFGLGWRHWTDRRRRRAAAVQDEMRERRFRERIPKLWDVWVSSGSNPNPEWKGILPLSAGAGHPAEDDHAPTASAPADLEAQRSRPPSATRFESHFGEAFGRFGRRVAASVAVSVDAPPTTTSEKSKAPDRVEEINHNGLEVAVIIQMPSAGSSSSSTRVSAEGPSSSMEKERSVEDTEVKEYALGTARVHLNRPLSRLP